MNDRKFPAMPSLFGAAATMLLATAGDDAAPAQLATHALSAIERATQHLAQLLGDGGVRAILARSVALSSETFPWLAEMVPTTASSDPHWALLRAVVDRQEARSIHDGFVVLLATFFELLGRLVGASLVGRFLHDVWPDVFPLATKETT